MILFDDILIYMQDYIEYTDDPVYSWMLEWSWLANRTESHATKIRNFKAEIQFPDLAFKLVNDIWSQSQLDNLLHIY